MLHLDLFSGIGGFALAAERVWPGIEHVFCEIDPFCQAILRKHWPNSRIYGDIRTIADADGERRERGAGGAPEGGRDVRQPFPGAAHPQVDLLTGGFPCQPFSHAGRRKGTGDDRFLWPEMLRVIRGHAPRVVVAENVRGLLTIDEGLVFEGVCADLETLGYEVQPVVVPACAVGAPHRRDRVWIVANAKHQPAGDAERGRAHQGAPVGATGPDSDAPDPKGKRVRRARLGEAEAGDGREDARRDGIDTADRSGWGEPWPAVAARLCRLDDGLPSGLARPRGWRNVALKAYGNAIVPQVAERIFRAIAASM